MILDSGICSIYKIRNTAAAGAMPNETLVKISDNWYGELSFESSPFQQTESQEQVQISQRIRILQDKTISNKAIVIIGSAQYSVERLYHGKDDESGELITDLNLSTVVSAYDVG